MTDRPPHKGYPGGMITLQGGPCNRVEISDIGQEQVVCDISTDSHAIQAIYERSPGHPGAAFFLHNEYIKLPHE